MANNMAICMVSPMARAMGYGTHYERQYDQQSGQHHGVQHGDYRPDQYGQDQYHSQTHQRPRSRSPDRRIAGTIVTEVTDHVLHFVVPSSLSSGQVEHDSNTKPHGVLRLEPLPTSVPLVLHRMLTIMTGLITDTSLPSNAPQRSE